MAATDRRSQACRSQIQLRTGEDTTGNRTLTDSFPGVSYQGIPRDRPQPELPGAERLEALFTSDSTASEGGFPSARSALGDSIQATLPSLPILTMAGGAVIGVPW